MIPMRSPRPAVAVMNEVQWTIQAHVIQLMMPNLPYPMALVLAPDVVAYRCLRAIGRLFGA